MVDVTDKAVTERHARAFAEVHMSEQAYRQLSEGNNRKGDVLSVARIAGIQAAKKTADLIPLCHPLALSKVQLDFTLDPDQCRVLVQSFCRLAGRTGVEMEALTAASVAALTIYDMCKAVDPAITIGNIHLLEKAGGKRGHWHGAGTATAPATAEEN